MMKKLLAIVLGAVCMTAAADAAAPLSHKSLNLPVAGSAVKVKTAHKGVATRLHAPNPFKVAAQSVADLAGVYTFSAFDLFAEDDWGELEYDVEFTVANGRIAIPGLVFGEDEVVYADYNAATGEFTIPGNQLLGRYQVEDEDGQTSMASIYLKTYRLAMTDEEEAEADENGLIAVNGITGTYDDGYIEFDIADCLMAEDTDGYWYWGGYWVSFDAETGDVPVPDDTQWKAAGNATFTDGWIMSAYGIDPVEYPYEVALQVDPANPNRYRLENPYKNSPSAAVNDDNVGDRVGGIVFDVTDPACVVVETGHVSGYEDEDYGKYYLYNLAGYALAAGYTLDEAKAELGDACSTFDNGEVIIPDCVFGDSSDPLGCYGWQDEAGEDIEMIADIRISAGVTNVSVDPADAPAEYFNLQGQPVAIPVSGQVVIVRRGTDVRKAVIR